MPSDKATGTILLVSVCAAFSYYTFWVLVMPFVDNDHILHSYFPDRFFGLAAPFLIAWTVLMSTFGYIGFLMIESRHPSDLDSSGRVQTVRLSSHSRF
mmetsp:Transcript_52698/g.127634  ORF Transcript_52698/g.127634 Transcript_52698/m.127634 type:complete len:98 (-) Transcript_52698:19-312(-)